MSFNFAGGRKVGINGQAKGIGAYTMRNTQKELGLKHNPFKMLQANPSLCVVRLLIRFQEIGKVQLLRGERRFSLIRHLTTLNGLLLLCLQ